MIYNVIVADESDIFSPIQKQRSRRNAFEKGVNMASIVERKKVSLSIYLPESVYILKGIAPSFEYKDGVRTDKVIATTATVVNTQSFDLIRVKVDTVKPVVTSDMLMEAESTGKHIFIEFENAELKIYLSKRNSNASIEDSITASAFHIVDTKL